MTSFTIITYKHVMRADHCYVLRLEPFYGDYSIVSKLHNYNTIQFIDQFSHRGFSESIYI